MSFDRVEAQPVQTEGAAFSNAQNLAVDNQVGMAMSTGNSSDAGSYRLPGLEVVGGQQNPGSDQPNSLQPGGHAVELAPPGSPFSFQMFVPDNVQPNMQPDNNERGGSESHGTLRGRRGGDESDGTPGNSRGGGDAHRTLPEGGIQANPKEEIPNVMKPKDKPKPFGEGHDLGSELLNEAKRERIREFLRNHLRNGYRNKL